MISVWALIRQAREYMSAMEWCIWSMGVILFSGSLFTACIMDLKEQMVYRFLWLIGGIGACVLMVFRLQEKGVDIVLLVELGVFMVLQQLWFARFYGRADCHAFCVCAIAMAAWGLVLYDYVVHMLLTFVVLAAVQILRRNIHCSGKLKKPVALIPYISLAFWLWVDFRCGKWYI